MEIIYAECDCEEEKLHVAKRTRTNLVRGFLGIRILGYPF